MTEANGIATAEDFRQVMEFGPPEKVTLPKLGKAVLLQRPSPAWLLFNGRLPVTMAGKMSHTTDAKQNFEDLMSSVQWMFHLLHHVMVKPRCVRYPEKDDEISPDMIDMDDVTFIMGWAVGEEVDGTRSLNTFREERSAAHPGTTGG
jgi:hypothetical protein